MSFLLSANQSSVYNMWCFARATNPQTLPSNNQQNNRESSQLYHRSSTIGTRATASRLVVRLSLPFLKIRSLFTSWRPSAFGILSDSPISYITSAAVSLLRFRRAWVLQVLLVEARGNIRDQCPRTADLALYGLWGGCAIFNLQAVLFLSARGEFGRVSGVEERGGSVVGGAGEWALRGAGHNSG